MSARTSPRPERTPKHTPVQLHPAGGRDDAYYLARQWHHYFGVEYESNRLPSPPAAIAGWADDDVEAQHYGVIARHGRVQVGGAMASVVTGDAAESAIGPAPIDERALAGDAAVYIYLITVDSAWRDRGLGTKLLDGCLAWTRNVTTADTVVAHSWQRENHPSSAGLFERAGFERIVNLPDHYAGTGRASCPDCGYWASEDGTCECGAILYAKDVERTAETTEETRA